MTRGMNSKLWAVLLLTAGLLGSSFFFIKLTVESIPPVTLAAGRAAIAAMIVYGIMRLSGQRFPKWGREWFPLAVLGLLTAAIPYAAIAWGQTSIDSSLGGILFATIPVFSVLIAPLFLDEERIARDRILGAALGFFGVVLIVGPQALNGFGAQTFGALVTLVAAFSYAMGNIYARKQARLSPAIMAAGQLVSAAVVLVPLSLAVDSPWILRPTGTAILSLIIVALFSTAIAMMLLFWLIRNAGATNASLLAYFMPVAAVGLGTLALDETLSWGAIGGFCFILLGAAIVTGNLRIWKSSEVESPK